MWGFFSILNASVALRVLFALIVALPAWVSADGAKERVKKEITADHSQFEQLRGPFATGDEITRACLECHNRADEQVRGTHHWQWHVVDNKPLGKAGLIANNFCISSNHLGDRGCLDCHVGWNGKQGEINCLHCHSHKVMNWNEALEDIAAFLREEDPDSREIAEELASELQESITAIGQPGIENCGSCHFYSGGGDGVKRGDLGSPLLNAPRELDVHLSKEGAGLTCIDCHNTRNHQVPGRQYSFSANELRKKRGEPKFKSYLYCESCHTDAPHFDRKLNEHFEYLTCQACHIPLIARESPTKVWWDWSKAGKLRDGKRYHTKDEFGKKNYMTIKGEFRWEQNVVPYYDWFNGEMKSITLEATIDPKSIVDVQVPVGYPGQAGSKIQPFKVHGGKQPYDPNLNRLLAPMLSGEDGYWTTLDWPSALRRGMEVLNLPFSGDYEFIESRFLYPVHHTIPPKDMALGCDDCHHRVGDGTGSRMAGVEGVYVAGRGDLLDVTKYAWALVLLTLIGAVLHGITRIVVKLRRGE